MNAMNAESPPSAPPPSDPAGAGGAAGAGPEGERLEQSVALLARVGRCGSPSFSPDGARLAFVSDLTGTPQVWTVAAAGGWPDLVTALDDQVTGVVWSPAGDRLAFGLAPGGGMNEQVYLVRPDGTGLRRLTAGGRENNRLGDWTPDGRALAVTANLRRPDAVDAYLVDPLGGAGGAVAEGGWRLVAESRGISRLADVSRDGRRAVLWRMANRSDDDLYLIDLATGTEARLTPHEGPGSFGGGTLAPDGGTVYLSSNAGCDLVAFARVVLDSGGRPGPIEALAAREDAELQGFALTEDGTEAALVWNVAGRSELAFYDPRTGRTAPGPDLPAELATGLTYARHGRRLAFVASGAAAPADVWVLDRPEGRRTGWRGVEPAGGTGGRPTRVTRSPHPGVDPEALVRPELVRFPAHDGLQLSGWLYRPPGGAGCGPLVLSFHGGPEGQERPAFNPTYQALLGQGIAVLAPNVRGSSGFGKRFVNLDNGALRFDAVRDIEACWQHAVDSGVAHPRRVGIMGGSYGGYMTLAGLTEFPDRFAAGADLFGIANFETFFRHTEPWMAAISKVEYGDPDTEADLLRRLSPIHRLDRIAAPTIVLHGANDTNVPVVEAEQVVASLRSRGVPVEYVLFPDEGHGFQKAPNRVRATVAIVRWFVRHLRAA
jgi:dipeptidyl aminopeptidase/acylaminoacyl peptidase